MFEPDKDGVYARISASPVRRIFAVATLIMLGAILVYVSFSSQTGFVGRMIVLALGIVSLIYADMLRRATLSEIILTEDGVFDSTGRTLARFEDIVSIERGAFALKPSHGFSLVLRTSAARVWAPGMWWRLGKRVGVGGVTPAGASKFMAEQIAFRIAK